MSLDLERLPEAARQWRRLQLPDPACDDLELALDGTFMTGPRYLNAAQRRSVEARRCLPDGTGWELPLALHLDADCPVLVGEEVVLTDPEAVPLAVLRVEELSAERGSLVAAGPLTALRRRSHGGFPHLRRGPRETGSDPSRPVLAVVTERPLHTHDVAAVGQLAESLGSQVLILALTGSGRLRAPDAVVRALETTRRDLHAALRIVPLPRHPGLDAVAESRLAVRVAAAYGATDVFLPSAAGPWAGADLGQGLPAQVHLGPPGPLTHEELQHLLETGGPLPPHFTSPAVELELRRACTRPEDRGLVLLFTGLSGSGKSTLARAVANAVDQRTGRPVTLLDGDVVRSMLSSELTFSREHRELNVRRIGFVAAEIARHGGRVVCAPIAPYASSRAEMRRMVEQNGSFVLVHVSTPLEVCEARDRKGLYERARSGSIPAFTGVSDPYEEPTDADLVVDTSTTSLADCTNRVMELLTGRGLLPQARDGRLDAPASSGRARTPSAADAV